MSLFPRGVVSCGNPWRLRGSVMAGFLTIVGLAAADPTPDPQLAIPPRLQWNANYGYCGETSFISAGLYYGQYCSQFKARELASPNTPQSKASSQLLLGVNDEKAAKAMHLAATVWKPTKKSTVDDFLAWVEAKIGNSQPVVIGVFTNEYLFYGDTKPSAGDPDYDHIVPVLGVSDPEDAEDGGDDPAITFSDNGLWNPSGTPGYLFAYYFRDFPKTRAQANAKSGPIYSLKKDGTNYGITFTGVLDPNKETIPVRVTTNVNSELPKMKNGSNAAPTPGPITLTVTATIPNQNVAYVLYRYNDFRKVPDSSFNANAINASAKWSIPKNSGPQFVVSVNIQSDEVAVFRAVAAPTPTPTPRPVATPKPKATPTPKATPRK